MDKFNKYTHYFAQFLQILLIIAISILGIFLVLMLYRELIPLIQKVFASSNISNANILDEVIVFFMFFEFASMVISALVHKGHTSINFLMGLGVTALLRGLISAHGDTTETLVSAISILLLVIGMIIYNKYFKDEI